jgi:hypothetical protein
MAGTERINRKGDDMKDGQVIKYDQWFTDAMRRADMRVRYKNGWTTAGPGVFSAAMAGQVLDKLKPILRAIFNEALTLDGYTGRYIVTSDNSIEGRGTSPRAALADCAKFRAALTRYLEVEGR